MFCIYCFSLKNFFPIRVKDRVEVRVRKGLRVRVGDRVRVRIGWVSIDCSCSQLPYTKRKIAAPLPRTPTSDGHGAFHIIYSTFSYTDALVEEDVASLFD